KEVDRIRAESEARQRTVTDLQVRSAGKNQERDGLRRQAELFSRNLREVEEQKTRMISESDKTTQSLSEHQILLEQEKVRLDQLIDMAESSKSDLSRLQNDFETSAADT